MCVKNKQEKMFVYKCTNKFFFQRYFFALNPKANLHRVHVSHNDALDLLRLLGRPSPLLQTSPPL